MMSDIEYRVAVIYDTRRGGVECWGTVTAGSLSEAVALWMDKILKRHPRRVFRYAKAFPKFASK